jgi:hypothetical protein
LAPLKKIDEKPLKNPKPTLNPINLEPIINPGNEIFALQKFVKNKVTEFRDTNSGVL